MLQAARRVAVLRGYQLHKDGLIEAAEVVSVPGDNRPDKTIYRITEAGKASFQDLLHAEFKQSSFPQHPVFLTMPFIRHGDPAKVEALIVKQLDDCEARIERMNAVLQLKEGIIPRGSELMIRGFIQFGETEKNWLTTVLADARSGALFAEHVKPRYTAEQQ